MKVKSENEVAQLCPTLATPWTAAYQAPPSMGFSRQKYWSAVPLPAYVYIHTNAVVCMFVHICLNICTLLHVYMYMVSSYISLASISHKLKLEQ